MLVSQWWKSMRTRALSGGIQGGINPAEPCTGSYSTVSAIQLFISSLEQRESTVSKDPGRTRRSSCTASDGLLGCCFPAFRFALVVLCCCSFFHWIFRGGPVIVFAFCRCSCPWNATGMVHPFNFPRLAKPSEKRKRPRPEHSMPFFRHF